MERESIDENHPGVQELVAAGYGLQVVVKAMNLCRDVDEAMVHLDAQERGNTEGTSTSSGGEFDHQRYVSQATERWESHRCVHCCHAFHSTV